MNIFDKLLFYTYHKSFIKNKLKIIRSSCREVENFLNKEL